MQLGAGSILVGKYRLEHPLSRGGMGSVWVARHLQLGTRIAVKLMDPAYASSPAFRARFEREARASAQLKSPHVVQIHDFGFHEGVPYLVMELLQGEDLSAHLLRHGRLSLHETHRLLVQAGKALRSAHDAGLVHRDLKPANLFLARVDGEDASMLKLLDFGIAKETTSKLVADASTTGEVMGSPHYMSPEQLRAERDLDARSDLWALGVIVFRMVTGYLPFPGEVLSQVITRILVDPIPTATQLAPDLPPALDAFFARALARDRTLRFQHVRELVDALARIAEGPAFQTSSASGAFSAPFRGSITATPAPAQRPGTSIAAAPTAPYAPSPIPQAHHVSAGTLTGSIDTAAPRQRASSARTLWPVVLGATVVLGSVGLGGVSLYLYDRGPSAIAEGQPAPALDTAHRATTPEGMAAAHAVESSGAPHVSPAATAGDAGSDAPVPVPANQVAPTPSAGATTTTTTTGSAPAAPSPAAPPARSAAGNPASPPPPPASSRARAQPRETKPSWGL